MMKTTLLVRNENSEKAIKILNKHLVYSSLFSSVNQIKENFSKIHLTNLELDPILNALTHRSFCNENEDWPFSNNERFEFVGDSVLDLIISDKLIQIFPNMAEGPLSKFRSALVNEHFLAQWSRLLKIESYVLLGKGELKNKEQIQDSILADTFEALIGAVYLTNGYEAAMEVLSLWIREWEEAYDDSIFSITRLEEFDPKSRLQELALALTGEFPTYESQDKADGSFEVSILIAGKNLGQMISTSKRKAEKALAYDVLKKNMINNLREEV